MARTATARRSAVGRSGLLDRPARRHVPVDSRPTLAVCPRSASDGPALPATPGHPIIPPTASDVTTNGLWALLPAADRERFGLRLSRLVLRAARTPDSEEDG
jgi:hypothetical protein